MTYSIQFAPQQKVIIPMEDPIIHKPATPFCLDSTCPCHDDKDNIKLLEDLLNIGVLTEQEARQIMKGK